MRSAIIFALLAVTFLQAQGAPPSESSVNEMLRCLQVDKLLTQALGQMTDGLNKAMEQRLKATMGDRELSTEQKAAMEKFRNKFSTTLQDELSLTKVRGIYLQCYKETFTQDEVDGVIGFYKSPAGMAISERYPQVMQKAQTMMQARIGPMSDKVQAALDDLIRELENGEKKTEKEKRQ